MSTMYQDYKQLSKTLQSRLGTGNIFAFILMLALILCFYSIATHFIAKWDGHFHDTKGCTTLQGFHGKLFKVNSCDSKIEAVDVPYEYKKPAEMPSSEMTLPPPDMKPEPIKKPAPPKQEPAPPKQSPYMI